PESEPGVAEDTVADRELGDGGAGCYDLSRKLTAEDRLPRSADAGHGAAEDRDRDAGLGVGFARVDVQPVYRRGVHLDQDLVLLGCRPFDVHEPQDFWGPVPVIDNCPHDSPCLAAPLMVTTTFPVLCHVSTYRVASITPSSGWQRSMPARYLPAAMSSFMHVT